MHTRLLIRPQMSISPQLVMAGQWLQVPGSDLEQFINRELVDNPALELANKPANRKEDLQLTRSGYTGSSKFVSSSSRAPGNLISPEEIIENIPAHQAPLEKLLEQISFIADKRNRDIAISLLHRLDHRGFLVTPLEELAGELGVSHESIIEGIRVLHQLEPPGIGSRDTRECFLMQCSHLEAQGIDCRNVRRILTVAWDEFLNQQWDRVARKIKEPKEIVEDACEFMRSNFYPHPLGLLDTSPELYKAFHQADLIIKQNPRDDPSACDLEIPGEEDFELRLSLDFQEMLDSKAQEEVGLSANERIWIKFHVERASMVIAALRQRWQTLRQIGEYLMKYQKDFLERGPVHLKPLTRVAVARKLNIHESTVSRAVSNKVIQLPNGRLIPLSDFFDPSLAAKEAIRRLLESNSQRICDRKIAEDLQANGMNVSRRTITKYRREININSSRRQSVTI